LQRAYRSTWAHACPRSAICHLNYIYTRQISYAGFQGRINSCIDGNVFYV
jgi:prenyltransferase beta subunit